MKRIPKIIHRMLRVLDLEKSFRFYADCFGLKAFHRLDCPRLSSAYFRNAANHAGIDLPWNNGQIEPCTRGDGDGHGRDAAAGQARLASPDDRPLDIKTFKAGRDSLTARYLFIQGPNTYQMEALERHGHYP